MVGYEEMTPHEIWFAGCSISCSICGCVVDDILRGSEDEIQDHLLNAHNLFPIHFDRMPEHVQAEAIAEFGNRFYRNFDYYFRPEEGKYSYTAIKVVE